MTEDLSIESTMESIIQKAQRLPEWSEDVAQQSHDRKRKEQMIKAGWPERHVLQIGSTHGPSHDAAYKREETIKKGDCLVILTGDNGPGKTQIATIWGYAVMMSRYYKAADLVRLIRGEFSGSRALQEEARTSLKEIRACPLLVIDEMSELKEMDYERQQITNVLDHRYDRLLATIIISNKSATETMNFLGPSIWSRAEETGGTIKCDWNSYRKKHANR